MGVGEFMVQTALGHASSKTTRDYVHIKNQSLRDQLENLADGNKPSSPAIITPWGIEGE